MRLLAALGFYIFTVFIGGAMLAPWLHALAQWGAEQFSPLEGLAYQPFHRYVNRCFMVLAIVGLWPVARLARLSWKDAGWKSGPDRWRTLRMGILAGFITLAIPALICVLAGGRDLRMPDSWGLIAKHFGNAIGAAVLVSLLEEAVFRGVFFGVLRKAGSLALAVGLSSGIYALVHFFERSRHEGDVVWSSGLALFPKMLRGFAEWDMIIPGFFSLTVAGIILALAVRATGNLYFSIGMHAGWIFWLKTFKFFTQGKDESHAWLWGTGKLIDGWIAFVVLLGTLWWFRKKNFFVTEENEQGDQLETDTASDRGGG